MPTEAHKAVPEGSTQALNELSLCPQALQTPRKNMWVGTPDVPFTEKLHVFQSVCMCGGGGFKG